MGYVPTPCNAAAVRIHLGVIGACTVTGTAVTASAPLFDSADAGTSYVCILGAGADGAAHWSAVQSVTDSTHATLATAAVTALVSARQVTLFQRVDSVLRSSRYVLADSWRGSRSMTTRTATFDFAVYCTSASYLPVTGQPVLVTHDTLGDLFGGRIEQVETSNISTIAPVVATCQCTSWDALLAQRMVFAATPEDTTITDRIDGSDVLLYDRWNLTSTIRRAYTPFVYRNGVLQTVAFSEETYPDDAAQWYYNWRSNVIVQKHSDYLTNPLGTGDYLDVTYATGNQTLWAFYDKTTKYIVEYLVNAIGKDALDADQDEGLTPSVSDTTSLSFFEITDEKATFEAALDALAARLSDGTTNYFWYVTPRKVVTFGTYGMSSAPWSIDETTLSDGNVMLQVSVTTTREKYANSVRESLSATEGDVTEELYRGDGSTIQFRTTYPMQKTPQISILTDPQIRFDEGVPVTVGVADVDVYAEWYWKPGTSEITQNLGVGLLETQQVAIRYTPLIPTNRYYAYDAAIDARRAIEGGSGQTDLYYAQDNPVKLEPGDNPAENVAKAVAALSKRLSVRTHRSGLDVNQAITVHLSQIGITADTTYIVESVEFTSENKLLVWNAEITNGAIIGDYLTALKNWGKDPLYLAGAGAGLEDANTAGNAPNVTAMTASVTYGHNGLEPQFRFTGDVTVDEGAAAYERLKKIHIVAVGPDGATTEDVMLTLEAPFTVAAHKITYTTGTRKQDTKARTYRLEARCENPYGKITPSPYYLASVSVAAATGDRVPPSNMASLALAEYGSRWQGEGQLTYCKARVTGTVTVDRGNQAVTIWLSYDNGVTWTWINWYSFSGSSFTIDIDTLVNLFPAGATLKAAAIVGEVQRTSTLPSGAMETIGVAFTGLGMPAATATTGFAVADAVSYTDSTGKPNWRQKISWTDGSDANGWYSCVTFFACDAAGNPAPAAEGGTEIARNSLETLYESGKYHEIEVRDWGYNPPGSAYHYGYWKQFVARRVVSGVVSYTQQNIGPGGSDHIIKDFGESPSGASVVGTVHTAVVTGVALTETGTRWLDDSQLTHATLRVSVTLSSSITDLPLTVWLSFDGMVTWTWINWYIESGSSATIDIDVILNEYAIAGAAAYAAVCGGAIPRTSTLPSAGTVVSTMLSLSGLGAVSDESVTGLTLGTVYDREYALGLHDWYVQLTGTCASDPYGWYVAWRFRCEDVAGNAAPAAEGGNWTPWIDEFTYVPGMSFTRTIPPGSDVWGYNDIDSIYHYGRVEVCVARRMVSGVVARVTQKWPSGYTYGIFDFGVTTRTLKVNHADPSTVGQGLVYDPYTDKLDTSAPGSNLVPENSFESYSAGAMGVGPWTRTAGVTVISGSAYHGDKHIRCTGAGQGVYAWIQVDPGETYYFAVKARSSNSADAHHSGYISLRWFNAARDTQLDADYASLSGYKSTWTDLTTIGTAPASCSWLYLCFETDYLLPSGQYWEFDYGQGMKFREYTDSSSSQQYSEKPQTETVGGTSGTTFYRHTSTADSSKVYQTLHGFRANANDGGWAEVFAYDDWAGMWTSDGVGNALTFLATGLGASIAAQGSTGAYAQLSATAAQAAIGVVYGGAYSLMDQGRVQFSASTGYLYPFLVVGPYYFWVDGTGRFRIKVGTPTFDTDGTVVGTQT